MGVVLKGFYKCSTYNYTAYNDTGVISAAFDERIRATA